MLLIERLTKAKASIAHPINWGKGEDRDCACALDALRVLENETDGDVEVDQATDALLAALPDDFEDDTNNWNHPVAQFNDDPETTHSDIMALYDRAIARAEGREG